MKITTQLFFFAATFAGLALVARATNDAPCCPLPAAAEKPACCPAPVAAKPACCSDAPAIAANQPEQERGFSSRSIYQLDAAWTNDAGAPVTLAAFRGQPVIVAMFFAQCEYACPVLVNDIQRLRATLPEKTRREIPVVLVSFDTKRDTPSALRAYRARAQLDADWTLLHGETDAVQELAMLLGIKFKQDARGQFAHSNLFTILNAEGEIAHQQLGLNGDIAASSQIAAQLAKSN